jgi:DHA1 family bicyclomycin/chloramphenicol resistance-like MFS transporter
MVGVDCGATAANACISGVRRNAAVQQCVLAAGLQWVQFTKFQPMTPPPAATVTADMADAAPRRFRILLPVLAMLTAFAPLSIDMYLPSFPLLTQALATDASRVQLTLSAFLLGFSFSPLVYGPLADRFGRRPILMGAAVLYIGASALCAVASDIDHLIALRFLQALGAGAGPVIVRAIIRDLYSHEDAVRTMSLMMVIVGVIPMLAPLLGGVLLVEFGWRSIFWVLAGFGLVCIVLIQLALRESLPPQFRRPLAFKTTLGGYASLLINARYLGFVLTGSLLFAGMFAYLSGSPFVFIELFGVSERLYGVLFAVNVAGMVLTATINSRLVRRYGPRKMLRAGVVIVGLTGIALLFVGISGIGGLPLVMASLFPLFCALSLVAPNATASALQDFPHMAGTASALAGALQFGLGALSGALVGIWHDGTPLPMMVTVGTCALASATLYLVLVVRRERRALR